MMDLPRRSCMLLSVSSLVVWRRGRDVCVIPSRYSGNVRALDVAVEVYRSSPSSLTTFIAARCFIVRAGNEVGLILILMYVLFSVL